MELKLQIDRILKEKIEEIDASNMTTANKRAHTKNAIYTALKLLSAETQNKQ